MGLFDLSFKSAHKDLKKMLKEKERKEKKINKAWEKRNKDKYSADVLKAAKNQLIENAMTIDSLEYEKLSMELKERLSNKNKVD